MFISWQQPKFLFQLSPEKVHTQLFEMKCVVCVRSLIMNLRYRKMYESPKCYTVIYFAITIILRHYQQQRQQKQYRQKLPRSFFSPKHLCILRNGRKERKKEEKKLHMIVIKAIHIRAYILRTYVATGKFVAVIASQI